MANRLDLGSIGGDASPASVVRLVVAELLLGLALIELLIAVEVVRAVPLVVVVPALAAGTAIAGAVGLLADDEDGRWRFALVQGAVGVAGYMLIGLTGLTAPRLDAGPISALISAHGSARAWWVAPDALSLGFVGVVVVVLAGWVLLARHRVRHGGPRWLAPMCSARERIVARCAAAGPATRSQLVARSVAVLVLLGAALTHLTLMRESFGIEVYMGLGVSSMLILELVAAGLVLVDGSEGTWRFLTFVGGLIGGGWLLSRIAGMPLMPRSYVTWLRPDGLVFAFSSIVLVTLAGHVLAAGRKAPRGERRRERRMARRRTRLPGPPHLRNLIPKARTSAGPGPQRPHGPAANTLQIDTLEQEPQDARRADKW